MNGFPFTVMCYCKYTSLITAGLFGDLFKFVYIIVHRIKRFHMFLRQSWTKKFLIDVMIIQCVNCAKDTHVLALDPSFLIGMVK